MKHNAIQQLHNARSTHSPLFTTDLYQPRQICTFDVVQLGCQNKTCTGDQLPLWLGHETLTNNHTSDKLYLIDIHDNKAQYKIQKVNKIK